MANRGLVMDAPRKPLEYGTAVYDGQILRVTHMPGLNGSIQGMHRSGARHGNVEQQFASSRELRRKADRAVKREARKRRKRKPS